VAGVTEPISFGRYELRELLAVGGMAEIFLARARLGGIARTCVIKRILPEYSRSRPFVSMFIDEARITIGLDHEHIVKLLDFGQVDGAYFMAMEYVDGFDLVEVLRLVKARGEGLPPLVAAYIARCVAAALAAAHDARDHREQPMQIVHRDVSPHNVFLSWNGAVKLGDFGIASARNKLHQTNVPGTVKGKYGYMSPEQAGGTRVDGRTDVWATGVVLWEMLVGGRLFATDNPIDTIRRVNEMPVPAPSELRSGIGRELDAIVLSALRRPLALRTSTAAQLRDALDAFIDGRFGPADLAALWPTLGLSPQSTRSGRARSRPPHGSVARPATQTVEHADEVLRALHDELRAHQNLWTLVDIGERHAALGQRSQGLDAVRMAAAIFAHRGLLVQAVCACHAVRPFVDATRFAAELEALATLRGHDRLRLATYLNGFEHRGFLSLVQEIDPTGLGVEHTEQTHAHDLTPLLGTVGVEDFVRLATLLRVERKLQGATIVREGERSDALYALGRGRVVVSTASLDDDGLPAASSSRVSVASLSEGEFFGEFSFLTRSPRSATVEAASDVVLMRIDRAAVDELGADPSFSEPLHEFYKERVAELLVAKNPIIGALPTDIRRGLIHNAQLQRFPDGAAIVSEGESADEVFFVLQGEVEVHRTQEGIPVFINKLREGQFFGEMAALNNAPRSATVYAMGPVELLALRRTDLQRGLEVAAEVRALLERAMAQRAAETHERVQETTRIFKGV
jgi:serine/threonine protein kinase/CRP-like cAMP-binding protein